ncbi:MAG: carboxymuconolactone decarboxylase family protein [Bacillota bacterium]
MEPNKLMGDFTAGLGRVGDEFPELGQAFVNLTSAALVEGELSARVKELIAVALGVFAGCEYCIAYHVHKAVEEGATREEILEAAAVAVAFGGTPAMAKVATALLACLDEVAG